MEMLADKAEHNAFAKSEMDFFSNARSFKKDYYRKILTKQL